jgi:hypothetical protein
MSSSSAPTLIKISHFKPLRISFPAPGTYRGEVALILPDGDPTILSRITGNGGDPVAVRFFLDEPMTAAEMYMLIKENLPYLQGVAKENASPILPDMLKRLRVSPRGDRKLVAKLMPVDNPLEAR